MSTMAACKYPTEPRSPRRNPGFSYLNVPCSPSHSVHSQTTVPRHLTYDGHFNSLPRHIQLGGESINGGRQPQPRNRKQVNNALQDYLKSLNSMTRSIVLETETVEKEHQCEWKKMNDAKREEVVNDHFIPADIRFHYDFADYGERAPSCCSFTSSASWGGRHRTPSLNSFSMDNGPTHLSQPSDWEQWPSANVNTACGAPLALQRGRGGDGLVRSNLSRSNNDLLQRNQWQQSTAHEREELSRSQPSLYYYREQELQPSPHHMAPAPIDFVVQPTFNRLHKKQLSFRPSHKQHAVRPPPQMRKILPRDGLGSDGESQRTSDEDYEQRTSNNLLGFQRSKLRSYSMRSRRSVRGGSSNGGSGVRSSVRSSGRLRPKTPETDRKIYHHHHNQQAQSNEICRPSHYHNYSTDTDFDEEIDLPDDELMMDHIQSPTHKSKTEEFILPTLSPKPPRFSKSRRSLRSSTKRNHEGQTSDDCEASQIKLDSSTCDEKEDTTSLDGTIDSVSLLRVSSHDSLDTISISPSISSKNPLQSDDDMMSVGEQSRMQTPDSLLSSGSFSYRPKSKTAEMAIMRNRRGKRGGSSYMTVTSEFADRHTQFKSNMLLKKQLSDCSGSALTSASNTRASSPACSTPIPPSRVSSSGEVQNRSFLKPPSFSLPISKQNSLAESITSDLARSPDHLCSPPSTPLAIVYTVGNNLTAAEMQEKRESGYLSSSCESFQVAVPFRR